MKPINPNFWTQVGGQLLYRNLCEEQKVYAKDMMGSWRRGEIDEALLIYYEIYNRPWTLHIDDCTYQAKDCYIKEGDVVLDIGANIGIFNRFATDKKAKKVYSFEPLQANFQLLTLNQGKHSESFRLAVGGYDNNAIEMAYKSNAPGGSSIYKHDNGELQTVMGITIDTLFYNGVIEQPDFIKVDVEGAEIDVFNGICDQILKGVRCISMEVHHKIPKVKKHWDNLHKRLCDLGFNSYYVSYPSQDNQWYYWK